ncbi:hypothetical protein HED49_06680 [Ochrobactrum daejeonense]|nr:hypothetical protein [Brucella daejeonensis]
MLRKHIAPKLGSIKAVTLTRVDIQRAHTAMSKQPRFPQTDR